MTVVNCSFADVSGRPIPGKLYVRPVTFMPNGARIVAPEVAEFVIAAGGSSISMAPGPAHVVVETLKVRKSVDVTIPVYGPVSFTSLIGA